MGPQVLIEHARQGRSIDGAVGFGLEQPLMGAALGAWRGQDRGHMTVPDARPCTGARRRQGLDEEVALDVFAEHRNPRRRAPGEAHQAGAFAAHLVADQPPHQTARGGDDDAIDPARC